VERLGGRVEPVPRAYPDIMPEVPGRLHQEFTTDVQPSCGDGICSGAETKLSCYRDCYVLPPGRDCLPWDQREYQTLLLSGDSAGPDAGAGIRLLVIDTGVNKDHPDLDVTFCRNYTRGRHIADDCVDLVGHGTFVAGSAAANGGPDGLGLFGTAPGVTLGMAKVHAVQGLFMDAIVRAIEDGMESFNPHVISMSLSGPDNPELRNAIDAAVAHGTLFFTSAGNGGPRANSMFAPAIYDNVVAVGMVDAARIAVRWSSRGIDDGDDDVVSERELELTGGGLAIESTSVDGCYQHGSGTSASTPSVAGFAAANWQGSNTATRDFLQHVLAEDVDNTGRMPLGWDDTTPGFDTSTGYGLPRTTFGTDGKISASVKSTKSTVAPGEVVLQVVRGPRSRMYTLYVTSPSGWWAWGQFYGTSNRTGIYVWTWPDPGTWLVTVDFGGGLSDAVDVGGGTSDFGAAFTTFEMTE
jgi:subtilisin family serine protease